MATHPAIQDKSIVYALLALMLFNASRFHARQDEQGNIFPMSEQDRSRSIALSRVKGPAFALDELEKLQDHPYLQSYYLFYATQAELYMEQGKYAEATACLQTAIHLAPLKAEKELLQKKLETCRKK